VVVALEVLRQMQLQAQQIQEVAAAVRVAVVHMLKPQAVQAS